MKIFSNGSSFASGKYPEYLAKMLNADLTNIAMPGYSNRSVWRTTTMRKDEIKYDLAIIQLTSKSRTEYFDEKQWVEISVQLSHERLGEKRKLWKYWYENMYADQYGDCEENFAIEGLRGHFAVRKIPCIIVTTDKYTKSNKFDMNLFDIDFPMDKTNHPTDFGHRMIAKTLYNHYETIISRV